MKRFGWFVLVLLGAVLTWKGRVIASGITQQAYNLIENAGSALTRQTTLNFTGAGISCANDGTNNRTTCTVSGGSGTFGGVNVQTGNYTLQASDSGLLVVMNCSLSCTATLYGTPSSGYSSAVVSIGASLAAVSLNSLNYNGTGTAPTLTTGQILYFGSNGTNYFGNMPFVASTNVTFTPGSNNVGVSASGGGGSSNGNYFYGSLTALSSGSWSTIGSGCTTSFVTGPSGAAAGALKIVGSTGSQNACGEQIAVSGNFTHTFVFFADEPAGNFSTAAVGFTDGTKLEVCGLGFFGSNNPSFSNTEISYTALSGGTLASPSGNTTALYGLTTGPIIIQLVKSGLTLTCDYAADGGNFVQLFSDSVPFLTPTDLVAIVDPRGVATNPTNLTLVSYQ